MLLKKELEIFNKIRWLYGMSNIHIVLVHPLYGGNVGSVCRAMDNAEFSSLRLVAPHDLNLEEARWMACKAEEILKNREEFSTLQKAIADCSLVVGVSARTGSYREHALPPREMAPKIVAAAKKGNVALVFGREDHGLSNEDLSLCGEIICIPSNPKNHSLNLSHAVMVCCYEIYLAGFQNKPSDQESPEISSELREKMFEMWEKTLLEMEFMPEGKAPHMMMIIKRILSRGCLTEQEAHVMMSIARKSLLKAKRDQTEK